MPSEPVVLIASAEFTLKSSPVRRTLEQRLVDDLRTVLKNASFDDFLIEKHAARLVVRKIHDPVSAAQTCSRVFGVAYAAPAEMVPASLDVVTQTIIKFADETLHPGQSFAIRAHRATPTKLSRRDIEVRGGFEVLGHLKERNVKVDLTRPDVTISVDLADDRAYVYAQKLQGPSGLPISSHWKMLGILDSGPLSILAAYAMMRRGCLVELLIPISERVKTFNKEAQLNLARTLRRLVTRPNYRVHILQLEGTVGEDALDYTWARELVRKAGLAFAKEKHFKGVVISDVVGPINTHLTERYSELPVFHPLIGLDFEDLLEMCRVTGISEDELASEIELENAATKVINHEVVAKKNVLGVEPEQVLL